MKKVHNFLKTYGRTIMAIAITAIAPNPFVGGFLSGLVTGGDLKSALIGGVTAVMFAGLHDIAPGLGKVFAHGMVGGISSVMSGGDFKSGFMAAAFTQAFSWKAGEDIFGGDIKDFGVRMKNAFAAAIIGGTASVIGGGKFANGAITGAMSRMFNDLQLSIDDVRGAVTNPRATIEVEIDANYQSEVQDYKTCEINCVLEFVNPIDDTVLEKSVGTAAQAIAKEQGASKATAILLKGTAESMTKKINFVNDSIELGRCLASCGVIPPTRPQAPNWSQW
jgi:hypothetical protein